MTQTGIANAMVITDDLQHISQEALEGLDCGDTVIKVTGNERHAYKVSYRDEIEGEMCLTYADHENVEEVYFERNENGVWEYKQKDNTNIAEINEIPNVEEAEEGTIDKVLGLNSSGDVVKGTIAGGTKLYKHEITMQNVTASGGMPLVMEVISLDSTEQSFNEKFNYFMLSAIKVRFGSSFPITSPVDKIEFVCVYSDIITKEYGLCLYYMGGGASTTKLFNRTTYTTDGTTVTQTNSVNKTYTNVSISDTVTEL